MEKFSHASRHKRWNFSLIELLVVVAIIAILAGMLLPALNKARNKALSIKCVSNLKQLGVMCSFYASAFDDFIMPVHTSGVPDQLVSWHEGTGWLIQETGKKALQQNRIDIIRCPSVPNGTAVYYTQSLLTGKSDPNHIAQATLRENSYTMATHLSGDPLYSSIYPLHKLMNVTNPSRTVQIADGTGATNYMENEIEQLSRVVPPGDGYGNGPGKRRIDYRHGGSANVLTLAGSVTRSRDIPCTRNQWKGLPYLAVLP